MNGKVETYKDKSGGNVGPARVWVNGQPFPGLAMSRSLGDQCAHSVGVISTPEVKEFTIDQNDKILILATDGVWEFLSDSQILDFVVPFWHSLDAESACQKVIKESVASWKREENSIDDITVTLVFFNDMNVVSQATQSVSKQDTASVATEPNAERITKPKVV